MRVRPYISSAVVLTLALLAGARDLTAQSRDIRPSAPAALAPTGDFYANSWALVIGVNAYHKVSPRLNYAVADGRAMAAALPRARLSERAYARAARWGGDEGQDRERLLSRLRQGRSQRPCLCLLRRHGQTLQVRGGEEGYLLPVDADAAALPLTGLLMEDMKRIANRLGAKHVFFALDACFSGFALTRDATSTNVTDVYLQTALREPVGAGAHRRPQG